MRYDAAILGAGPDGLAAAARLARAGLKTIVLEKSAGPGGRCTTATFHPGFRASPFADELAPVPAGIFWSLDLARRGAIFFPQPLHVISGAVAGTQVLTKFCAQVRTRIAQELRRADGKAEVPPAKPWLPWQTESVRVAPLDDWSLQSMTDMLADLAPTEAAALMARALAGRAADPTLRGSALHLLAPGLGSSGIVTGGLATLGAALAGSAREAGAEIVCSSEATGIRQTRSRVAAIALADGSEIETAAAISTLDFKRTMLSLFRWSDLPEAVMKRATHYRTAGSTARFLIALEAMPRMAGDAALSRATFHTASTPEDYAHAYAAWRSGVIPEKPPASLRIVSAGDLSLAPRGQATVTMTLGCIPHRLFDGAWTEEHRGVLRDRALAALGATFPDAKILGSRLLVPPDFEEALGATDGDLAGGEIAPDQMFANRACPEWPRTPIAGLYLGGPSSPTGPLATGASGWIAAKALIADRGAGRS
ncbi:MAG TPA: FAD-dependent oxidoreductase [Rhizomicrobium sp.]